jgi:hypothetical protein
MVVMYTGGNAPPDQATPILQWLAVRETFYVPHAVVVWALVGVLVIVALTRTPFGRYVYAAGNSERVTYLSGISTRTILIVAFVTSGTCSAFAGAMLAGYAGKAYQAMVTAGNRRRGSWRHQHSGRPRKLSRHRCRSDPNHRAGKHPVGDADIRFGAPDHIRRDDRRDDAGLRPRSPS